MYYVILLKNGTKCTKGYRSQVNINKHYKREKKIYAFRICYVICE